MSLSRPLLAALLPALFSIPLRAQEVRLEGRAETPAVRIARQVLADARYLRITRDTILPESFRTPGDLVVVDAEVRLEGAVEGRIAVLGGDLFIRPGARIGGPIAVVGGAVYSSALASVGEIVQDTVQLRVALEPDPATGEIRRVTVTPPPRPGPLALPGIFGLRIPTYDRVNGFTLTAGPRLLAQRREEGPTVDGWVQYYTAREEFGAGVEGYLPLPDSLYLRARAGREVFTNERWIRGDLTNTLSSLVVATDERDYYESDRVSLTFGRLQNRALAQGQTDWAPRLTLFASHDRALDARNPFSVFGDLDRENLRVDEGTVASAAAGVTVGWRGRFSTFAGDASVEQGFAGVGDFGFTHLVADGLWMMQTFRRHQASVRFHAAGSIGGAAPRQRWSFVGGPNTLTTFRTAEFRGDRVAYVESTYGIPLRGPVVPVLGAPTLRFVHATGMAWAAGAGMPAWEQNLGVGLWFSFVRADVFVDPAGPFRPQLSAGLILPGM